MAALMRSPTTPRPTEARSAPQRRPDARPPTAAAATARPQPTDGRGRDRDDGGGGAGADATCGQPPDEANRVCSAKIEASAKSGLFCQNARADWPECYSVTFRRCPCRGRGENSDVTMT